MTGRILNEMCSSRVCIDEYCDGIIRGRIYNNYLEEPLTFQNVMQMLKKMDAMFDAFEYPQKTVETRSFFETEKQEEMLQTVLMNPSPQDARGKKATFHVKVVFRKNATWQGNVTWIDENKEESFRSVLELLMLFESALSHS